jgi:hypothetical protein
LQVDVEFEACRFVFDDQPHKSTERRTFPAVDEQGDGTYSGNCDMDVDECASSPCVIDFNSLQRGDYFCPCNTGYSGQNCSGDVDSIYGSSTTAQLSLRTTHDAVLWITTTALVGSSVSGNAYYCSFVAIAVVSLLPFAKAMDPEAVAETAAVAPILAIGAIGGAAVSQLKHTQLVYAKNLFNKIGVARTRCSQFQPLWTDNISIEQVKKLIPMIR